ncbi:hypothetical protein A6X21_22845 [Planctopirus hydrillae]|uniref:Uncharacterized protein n=1 Tax=Planctopirus hydrillae TaxID=1841610 RepID=A0A1C3ECT9_9PLAN|nr:hypothetical protein A6X21_22845 [Planctopirus hydrillae]
MPLRHTSVNRWRVCSGAHGSGEFMVLESVSRFLEISFDVCCRSHVSMRCSDVVDHWMMPRG